MLISECAETNGTGKISPNGRFAVLSKSLLVKLYELSENLKILHRWNVLDEVSSFEWSTDGELVLCLQKKRGVVQVFSVENPSWTALVNPGVLGISHSRFAGDGRSVLTFDSQGVRLSVWNLTNGQVSHIKFPKFTRKGLSFAFDGKRMALVVREKSSDFIAFYETEDWVLKHSFQSPVEVGDVFYLKDSSGLALWTESFGYSFCVVQVDGTVLMKFEGNPCAPGICKVEFSKNFVAVCGMDHKLRVFHLGSWVLFHEFCYARESGERMLVLKESEEFRVEAVGKGEFEGIQKLLGVAAETAFCVWGEGRVVCTVVKGVPNVIWVWDCRTAGLASVIVLRRSVKSMVWADGYLVWVCGENLVYMWNESQEVLICNSGDVKINKIEYSSGAFLLQNKLLAIYSKLN